MDLEKIRREYTHDALDERQVASDPITQFRGWLEQAIAANLPEATAMALATADAAGQPSCRIVLLKGVDDRGFVFYTNYESRKGRELTANPRAALTSYWPALDRQVRVEGTVAPTTEAESKAYFASRPSAAQIGAWASPQSRPLANREDLERRFREVAARHAEGAVPLPPFWGGFRLKPHAVEFWQGRQDRLHDRVRYSRPSASGNHWRIERLAP
jgi:pyridoxamine 5'-phosphate oxidase